jgi:signal transduction histidine kinase
MNHSLNGLPILAPASLGRATASQSQQVPGWLDDSTHKSSPREFEIRLDEQQKERTRIARELHDTLFQGFVGASMILNSALDELPADSPSKNSVSRALLLIHRVIDEGRRALDGLRSRGTSGSSLEKAFAGVRDEFGHAGAQLRISAVGRPTTLNPAVLEEIYLIGREALVNALRHSGATLIEAEIEYFAGKLRVVVRDNGLGMNSEILDHESNSHWGIVGMRERANKIGAQLRIWSKKGAGTEVEICLQNKFALSATSSS